MELFRFRLASALGVGCAVLLSSPLRSLPETIFKPSVAITEFSEGKTDDRSKPGASEKQRTGDSNARAMKFSRKLVELTNKERVRRGLMPLKLQTNLNAIALWFARDMSEYKYLDHEDRLHRTIEERAEVFKYDNWNQLGENIAKGYETPEEVFKGWMKSPGHRDNILSKNFTEVGFGSAKPVNSPVIYWVQEFGRRSEVHPLVLNLDDEDAPDDKLTLHIHGDDWAKEMRFRCDEREWSDWRPFMAICPWKLDAQTGKHCVCVELRNGDEIRSSVATVQIIPAKSDLKATNAKL